MHKWTEEEISFLRSVAQGNSYRSICTLYRDRFQNDVTDSAVYGTLKRNGIVNGIDQKFKKGQKSHNKGAKGITYPGMEKTQFRKGNRHWNYKPVGSERINTDGYAEVKIAEPNVWKGKHILVWEKHYGKVPKGSVVVITGANRLDPQLGDVMLISRKRLAIMNKRGLTFASKEIAETGKLVADLIHKTAEKKKKRRK